MNKTLPSIESNQLHDAGKKIFKNVKWKLTGKCLTMLFFCYNYLRDALSILEYQTYLNIKK